jgi:DNA processing protein
MTHDEAVALSLLKDLPRVGLTERLRADDPVLLERAAPLLPLARDIRRRGDADSMLVLPWTDARYPASLLAIPDLPPALWCRGDVACLDSRRVAIVGSRAASPAAREIAAALAEDLTAHGITVVSGLARGIDSAAHRGALRAGRTIAVLGSGVDRVYPHEHAALAAEIAVAGLVLTEYPPGTPPLPFHFPMRNRIISGLSRAVVVIEAHEKSGSLITAACALEQGREVMAVPGTVLGGRNRGGHALIRDGAAIVESAADILEALGWSEPAGRGRPASDAGGGPAEQPFAHCHSTISGDPVLVRMVPGHAYDLDALAAASGMEVTRLLPYMMDLELTGRVRRLDGGRFVRPA